MEAEYTITNPSDSNSNAHHVTDASYANMAREPRGSELSIGRLLFRFAAGKGAHGGDEHLAAMQVIAKHVEARACGRQQHCVTRLREMARDAHGVRQSRRMRAREIDAHKRTIDAQRV